MKRKRETFQNHHENLSSIVDKINIAFIYRSGCCRKVKATPSATTLVLAKDHEDLDFKSTEVEIETREQTIGI